MTPTYSEAKDILDKYPTWYDYMNEFYECRRPGIDNYSDLYRYYYNCVDIVREWEQKGWKLLQEKLNQLVYECNNDAS